MEANGVPLTKSRNDRTAAGFPISEWLQTPLADGLARLQIHQSGFTGVGCPMLIKTLPAMRVDQKHPSRLADGMIIGLSRSPTSVWQRRAHRE
jgi:hypothetical protein